MSLRFKKSKKFIWWMMLVFYDGNSSFQFALLLCWYKWWREWDGSEVRVIFSAVLIIEFNCLRSFLHALPYHTIIDLVNSQWWHDKSWLVCSAALGGISVIEISRVFVWLFLQCQVIVMPLKTFHNVCSQKFEVVDLFYYLSINGNCVFMILVSAKVNNEFRFLVTFHMRLLLTHQEKCLSSMCILMCIV